MKAFEKALAEYGPIDLFCCKRTAEDFWKAALEQVLTQCDCHNIVGWILKELED